MPIIFRLIGNANIDNFNINHNTNLPENIKLFDIINIFKEFGLDDDDFQYIKFAVDNKLIKDNIILSNHEKNPLNVFLFTPNNNIKEKLINIFSKRGYNPYDNTNENAKDRNSNSVKLVPTESAGESDEDSAVEPTRESDEDSVIENGKESGEESDKDSADEEYGEECGEESDKECGEESTDEEYGKESDKECGEESDKECGEESDKECGEESTDEESGKESGKESADEECGEESGDESVDEDINKPIFNKSEDEELTEIIEKVITDVNSEMSKLFDDNDFKHLVRIYYNNSDIFKKFLNYVNNGKYITIRKLTNNVSDNYLHEMNQLKELGVLKSDNEILEILQKFNGHLNLSLCTLLAN